MQAAGTRGQRPRRQEASAGCFPAVHPQCDNKWSGWGPQGWVRPRSGTGTPQLGRWVDSPPPPFRKGLADTLHPGPLPPQAEELSRSPCPSAPSSGSRTFPDFCPQSLPFSLDPRKVSRDNPSGSRLQDGQQQALMGGSDPQSCPCKGWEAEILRFCHRVEAWSLLSQFSPSAFFLPGQVSS